MNTIETLMSKVESSKSLDFGGVFNNCIDLFKKVWLQAFITMILTGLLILPFYIIIYIPLVVLGMMNPETFESGDDLSVMAFVFMIMGFILLFAAAIIISIIMRANLYRICKHKDLKISGSDDYFFFFKRKYFKKSITLGLFVSGILLLALLLFILPVLYVSIPVSYMIMIYASNPELEVKEIIKLGFGLGNKKWFFTFLSLIVAWFVSLVGLLLCFVGIYVTQQFIILPFYEIYKQTIGFDDKSEIEQIGIEA